MLYKNYENDNEKTDIACENKNNGIHEENYIITTTFLQQFNFEEQQVPSVEEVQLDNGCIYLTELEIDEKCIAFIAFKLKYKL